MNIKACEPIHRDYDNQNEHFKTFKTAQQLLYKDMMTEHDN